MPYFIKSLWHIQKIPQDSRLGYVSKTVSISWTMDSSWFTQESLAWKSDWWANSKLCSSRCLKRESNISLLNIFPQMGNRETGLQLLINCLSLFLWMGHIFNFFHISENVLWLTQFLKMISKEGGLTISKEGGLTIAKSHSFNILMDILSCRWA